MKLRGIRDEDFTQYKKPSLFIVFPTCTFKCEKESGQKCCQNNSLTRAQTIDISVDDIVQRYLNNPITKAIVCGGLEPFDTFWDLFDLVEKLREKTQDDIVIYTGYEEHEITGYIQALKYFRNIIIKFGRYIPDKSYKFRFDDILGITLASFNQYSKKIS